MNLPDLGSDLHWQKARSQSLKRSPKMNPKIDVDPATVPEAVSCAESEHRDQRFDSAKMSIGGKVKCPNSRVPHTPQYIAKTIMNPIESTLQGYASSKPPDTKHN